MYFVFAADSPGWKLYLLELPPGPLKIYFKEAGIGYVVLPLCLPAAELEAAVQVPGLPWPGLAPELKAYFEGGREIRGSYPLLAGTYSAWTLKVLQLTAVIPFGETRTYGEIARLAGNERGARAAGQALGRNCTPLLIPCHRVLGAGKRLTGFGAGLAWKARLLALEGCSFRK